MVCDDGLEVLIVEGGFVEREEGGLFRAGGRVGEDEGRSLGGCPCGGDALGEFAWTLGVGLGNGIVAGGGFGVLGDLEFEGEVSVLGDAGFFADEPIGAELESGRAGFGVGGDLEGDDEGGGVFVAEGDAAGGGDDFRVGEDGRGGVEASGEGPSEAGGHSGVAGVSPVDVPSGFDGDRDGEEDSLAGGGGEVVGGEGGLAVGGGLDGVHSEGDGGGEGRGDEGCHVGLYVWATREFYWGVIPTEDGALCWACLVR